MKKLDRGSFLMIDYIGRISATDEVFDLTDEEKAKKEGIHNPKSRYGPQLVIIGSGMTVPGVEEQLKGMKPGEERKFDVPKEKGFGKRDPGLIKVVSSKKFLSQNMNPVPGMFVNIDGRHARIQAVSGGRVRVDFNSVLAGKDLSYEVKVVRVIVDVKEKAQAMLDYYGVKAGVGFKEGRLQVLTREKKTSPQVQQLLTMQFSKWLPEAKKVEYVNPKPKPKSGAGKAKPDAAGKVKHQATGKARPAGAKH